jgi:hypothetical protein
MIYLNSIKQLIVVMAKCSVFFEVWTKFSNIVRRTSAYLFFKLSIKQSEIQNSACLPDAAPYYHNVFTFTSFLLEGREGVAWEPSNK